MKSMTGVAAIDFMFNVRMEYVERETPVRTCSADR